MRKKLLEENYSLLERFVPKLLLDTGDSFDYKKESYKFWNVIVERLDENLITINIDDFSVTILFDNDFRIARVAELNMNKPIIHGFSSHEFFCCVIDDLEQTETERKANDLLNEVLKTFSNQQ